MKQLPHIYGPATIDPEVTFGKNVTIWQYSTICAGTVIGDNSVIGSGVWIGKDCRIGKNCRFNHGCFIPNGTVIEDNCFFGPNVTLTDDKYPIAGNKRYKAMPPVIRSFASIGAGAVILPGVVIGSGAMVGAGAVVTRDVEASDLSVGMPSRPVRRDAERAVVPA